LFRVDRRRDITNAVEGKCFAKAHNTPVGYQTKVVVFKPSETDATLACVHFHGQEAADNEAVVQCHGHFNVTSHDCTW